MIYLSKVVLLVLEC